MEIKRLDTALFLAVLLVVVVVTFFLFLPYLNAIVLALTLAIVFHPVYKNILKLLGGKKSLASMVSIFIVAIVVILPIIYFSYMVLQETGQVIEKVDSSSVMMFQNDLNRRLPGFSIDLNQKLKDLVGWVIQNLGSIFSSISYFGLILLISLFALFYLFRDGDKLRNKFMHISPLNDEENIELLDKLTAVINSVVKGNLVVAVIQGFVAGLGLFIFGVPNSIFWGSVSILASMIPIIGTLVIMLPAALYLFISGHLIASIGMLLWGFFITGTIDNFIKPFIVDRGMNIHPFLVLLSIIGGLNIFGMMGFLIGPLIVSLLFALFEIYPKVMGKSVSSR